MCRERVHYCENHHQLRTRSHNQNLKKQLKLLYGSILDAQQRRQYYQISVLALDVLSNFQTRFRTIKLLQSYLKHQNQHQTQRENADMTNLSKKSATGVCTTPSHHRIPAGTAATSIHHQSTGGR